MKKIDIEIVNMADSPAAHVERAARWAWEEWGKPRRTLEETVYRCKHCVGRDGVPQMFAATCGGELVGTVSLWNNDLVNRQDLTPWLASLFIKEEYRGMGIGTALQKRCIAEAKALGFKKLYLITDHTGYYERTGWVFLEVAPLIGEKTTRIYSLDLN